jgi:hypothetical protein
MPTPVFALTKHLADGAGVRILGGSPATIRERLSMQARVTCPACQATLGVSAVHGDGTVLRCPQCAHVFAIRLRPQAPSTPHDPMSGPAARQVPPHHQPSASGPGQPAMPPAPSAAGEDRSSGLLLWVGMGGGLAIAVAALVLVTILMRVTAPTADQQNLPADAPLPSGEAASAVASAPAAPATLPPGSPSVSSPPGFSTPPSAGDLVKSARGLSGSPGGLPRAADDPGCVEGAAAVRQRRKRGDRESGARGVA